MDSASGRTYSQGTIRRYGDRWQAVLTYYDPDGKIHHISKVLNIKCDPAPKVRGKRDKPEGKGAASALKALAEWRAEVIAADARAEQERAEAAEAERKRVTVGAYVSAFVEQRAAMGIIEESTLQDYRKVWRNYIAPDKAHYLGGITLQDLTAADIRDWEAHLCTPKPQGAGYAPTTVRKAHRLLKEAITQARADGIITTDPMLNVKPPKGGASKPNALTRESAPLILSRLNELPETYVTIAARIAIYCGMRRGEICGLQWRDIDLQGRTLHVRRSVGAGTGGRPYLKAPKTDRARDVPIPDGLAPYLALWKSQQVETYLAIGATDIGEQFVIGPGRPGAYRDPAQLTREWSFIAKQFGIKGTEGRIPTFHDLRHTFATVAIAGGVDVKTVSSNLGHAQTSTTVNMYASTDPEAKRLSGERINELLTPRPHQVIPMNGTEG